MSSDPAPVASLDWDFAQDIHARFLRLRQDGPVHPVLAANGMPTWIVVSHAEARQLLEDPRLSKDFRTLDRTMQRLTPTGTTSAAAAKEVREHMLNMDPPDHTRLRKLVAAPFGPRRLRVLEPRIEAITTALLDATTTHHLVDLVGALAAPLPIQVICELIGIPHEERENFKTWSDGFAGVDPDWAQHAARHMAGYLRGLIEDKRTSPDDDLLSDLVAATDNGDRLTDAELVSIVFILIIAGHETTTSLITNTLLALLEHPAQLAAVRADPALIPEAIEETLRWEGAITFATFRATTESVRIGTTTIPAGQIIMISPAAAGRDDQRYTDAAQYDIHRSDKRHLGFGHGIHFCVGAALARTEARIALTQLLRRHAYIQLGCARENLQWRHTLVQHGLESLPLRL